MAGEQPPADARAARAARRAVRSRRRVLVENRHSFTISIVREHTKDIDRTIALLSQVAGSTKKREADRRTPPRRAVLPARSSSSRTPRWRRWPRSPRGGSTRVPDVVVEEVPTRQYPADALAAHLFGYVGEASDAQVATASRSGTIVGQSGLEKVYNKLLMGEDGAKRVVVNSLGREIRTLEEVPPVEGRRVQLTIDADLQSAAEDGFRHAGFNGAALMLDPRTARCSPTSACRPTTRTTSPSGIDRATWASLNTDRSSRCRTA